MHKQGLQKLFLSLGVFFICAAFEPVQAQGKIVKLKLYSKIKYAGTIAVNENGEPLTEGKQQVFFLYAETAGKSKASFINVKVDNVGLSIQNQTTCSNQTYVGQNNLNGDSVFITHTKPNILTAIELTTPTYTNNWVNKKQVAIKLMYRQKNKQYTKTIYKKIEELQPLMAQ